MIITKTPFRMSFFGGGTDMPEFFMEVWMKKYYELPQSLNIWWIDYNDS
jgi:hypothetical protein